MGVYVNCKRECLWWWIRGAFVSGINSKSLGVNLILCSLNRLKVVCSVLGLWLVYSKVLGLIMVPVIVFILWGRFYIQLESDQLVPVIFMQLFHQWAFVTRSVLVVAHRAHRSVWLVFTFFPPSNGIYYFPAPLKLTSRNEASRWISLVFPYSVMQVFGSFFNRVLP